MDEATSGVTGDGASGDLAQAEAAHLAELAGMGCADLAPKVKKMDNPELEEGQVLAGYTGLLPAVRSRRDALEEKLGEHPGLRFHNGKAADGNTYDIPGLVNGCESLVTETEGLLDGLLRNIIDLPVIEEIKGKGRRKKTVARARVEFELLEAAIKALAPTDSDVLMADVAEAKERVAK